jgi:acyl dehydratase
VFSLEKSFSVEDVRGFVQLSGDDGRHHTVPDARGRLMVHGLLTASLATQIGGKLNYILHDVTLEYARPVFTGDLIKCVVTIGEVVEEADRYRVATSVRCTNERDKEVLRGVTHGVILKVQPG